MLSETEQMLILILSRDVDLESPKVPLPELGFWQIAVRVVKMQR